MTSGATDRQREAIENHNRSMVVTAGAGTGKTFVLVEKYLSLVENEGLRPREILALTFTDKAAAEMKERVRNSIGRRIDTTPDDPFWKEVAEEVIIAPIMTFHSFCAQILREFAIEAGLEAGFQIIDEGRSLSIRKDAFDRLLKRTQSETSHSALIRVLAQIEKFRLQEMLTAISDRYGRFEQFFGELNRDPDGMIPIWQEYLASVRDPEITRFFSNTAITSAIADLIRYARRCSGRDDSAASYLEQVSPYLVDIRGDASPQELSATAQGFLSVRPRGRIGSQKVWDHDDLQRLRQAKSLLTSALTRSAPYFALFLDPEALFTKATLAFYSDLAILADEYQTHINALKRQESGMDFGDLIALAKQFLHENQDLVSEHLRPRIRYILIDEFQDTDPAQFDIISAIIGELRPETKGLFIVGDPKQSIYLFRDADVTRFKEAQSRILVDCRGSLINLDTSFRSSREVIGAVNHLFGGIFASTAKPWEFGYEPILTCEQRRKTQGSVQILLPEKAESGGTASDSKEIEAGMVADLIHRIVETRSLPVTGSDGIARPAEYGDIALLIERRTHLSRYMDALSRMETPYYVHGGIGFYSRQEIYDIFNILSFLLRPYDDAALYGVLRSPYFSLSDSTLFLIMTGTGSRRGSTLYERLTRYSREISQVHEGETSMQQIARAIRLLSGWTAYAGREPVVLLMNRVIRDSGIYSVYGAQEQGSQQIANLEKLMQIARVRSETSGYGLAELVYDMTASIGTEEREGEAALDTLSRTSVNIMTVHAAKGLEFPVVILPDMGSSREGKQSSILCGDIPEVIGIKIPNPDNGYEIEETPVYAAASLIQKEKEAAERKRLFYVGATRARDHLIFCGRRPGSFFLTVDESSNRIDWVCTLFGITEEIIESGENVTIEPDNEGEPIEIKILTDPDQLTREWAYNQPSVLIPPPEYLTRRGERGKAGTLPDIEYTCSKIRKRWSLSRILETEGAVSGCSEISLDMPGISGIGPEEAGTILHQIFAGADAEMVLKFHGISSPAAVSWCMQKYEAFLSHPIMERVVESHCEVPYIIPIGDDSIEGRMDRLCRRDDGSWVLIDYKSGRSPHAELQIAVYSLAAEALLNQQVEVYLYHIDTSTAEMPEMPSETEIIQRIEQGIARVSEDR